MACWKIYILRTNGLPAGSQRQARESENRWINALLVLVFSWYLAIFCWHYFEWFVLHPKCPNLPCGSTVNIQTVGKCRTLGLLLKSVVCFDNKRFKNRKKTHIHACIKFICPIYFSILFHFFSILLHASNTVHTVDSTQYKDNLGLKVQSYSGLSNMLSVQNISNRLLCAWSKLCRRVKAKSVIAYQFEEMGVQNKKQNKTVPNVGQDIGYICYWWQTQDEDVDL